MFPYHIDDGEHVQRNKCSEFNGDLSSGVIGYNLRGRIQNYGDWGRIAIDDGQGRYEGGSQIKGGNGGDFIIGGGTCP